jgi:hypothetical protein
VPATTGRELPPPAHAAGDAVTPAAPSSEAAPVKKKRGFWARVFGVGGERKNNKK